MDQTKHYPFRASTLQKGDRVSANMIEHAYSVERGTDQYQRALLNAREHIIRTLASQGEIVTLKQEGHDLVVLTDRQAATYNARRFEVSLRAAARSHVRALGVDRAQLTADEREEHDRRVTVQGKVLSAIRKENALAPSPKERVTPVFPKPKKDKEPIR